MSIKHKMIVYYSELVIFRHPNSVTVICLVSQIVVLYQSAIAGYFCMLANPRWQKSQNNLYKVLIKLT